LFDAVVHAANFVALERPNRATVRLSLRHPRRQRGQHRFAAGRGLPVAVHQPDGPADEGPVLPAFDIHRVERPFRARDVVLVEPAEVGAAMSRLPSLS
jgi:hypothetical protein